MSIIATSGGTEYKKASGGAHKAVCYRVADLGSKYSEQFDKTTRKCMISFEILDEQDDDGNNLVISWFGTLSLHEKSKLRPQLEGWRGKKFTEEELKGFDISKLLGVPVNLYLIEDEKYTNIQNMMKWTDSEKPAPTNSIMEIGFDTIEHFSNIETLSDKMKEDIKETPEYAEAVSKFTVTTFDPAFQAPIEEDEIL